jgi:Zn-dependent membrane protease YugP
MILDPIYFLFIGPPLLLSLWAQFRTKSAFKKYSRVRVRSGMTGAQAAKRLLEGAGISDVEIVGVKGTLSDHYNPVTRKLALSEPVFASNSIAAVGVACHEAGHAIQHANKYSALWLRSALVPTATIGSKFGYYAMLLGLLMSFGGLVVFGAVLLGAVLAFQIVTLPVEFDASARAKKLAVSSGIVTAEERVGVDRVLNAAALTYVAAAISTLMTMLYFLSRRN